MNVTIRLEQAITVATIAHRNQKRKGGNIPYIIHPFSVMCIASQATQDEDILIACLFHDIIEDVPEEYPRDRMLEDFGERVVSIVDGVTKNETIKSWQGRADAYLEYLKNEASDESVIVGCADKIHNVMSILNDYDKVGDELWERFNAGKDKQLWWYEEILAVVSHRMPDLELVKMLRIQVEAFRRIISLNG